MTTLLDRTVHAALAHNQLAEHVQVVGIALLIALLLEYELLAAAGSRRLRSLRLTTGPLLFVFAVVVLARVLKLR